MILHPTWYGNVRKIKEGLIGFWIFLTSFVMEFGSLLIRNPKKTRKKGWFQNITLIISGILFPFILDLEYKLHCAKDLV